MGSALRKEHDRWSLGIMTPIELEMLRGGSGNKQSSNNKLYLILSEKQKKYLLHDLDFISRLHFH